MRRLYFLLGSVTLFGLLGFTLNASSGDEAALSPISVNLFTTGIDLKEANLGFLCDGEKDSRPMRIQYLGRDGQRYSYRLEFTDRLVPRTSGISRCQLAIDFIGEDSVYREEASGNFTFAIAPSGLAPDQLAARILDRNELLAVAKRAGQAGRLKLKNGASYLTGTTGVRTGTSTGVRTGTSTGVRTGTSTGVRTGTSTSVRTGTSTGVRTGTSTGVRTGTSTSVSTGTSTGVSTYKSTAPSRRRITITAPRGCAQLIIQG